MRAGNYLLPWQPYLSTKFEQIWSNQSLLFCPIFLTVFYFLLTPTASEELSMGGMRFTTFDLGGHRQGTGTELSDFTELLGVLS